MTLKVNLAERRLLKIDSNNFAILQLIRHFEEISASDLAENSTIFGKTESEKGAYTTLLKRLQERGYIKIKRKEVEKGITRGQPRVLYELTTKGKDILNRSEIARKVSKRMVKKR